MKAIRIFGVVLCILWCAGGHARAGDREIAVALSHTAASLPVLRMLESGVLGPDVSISIDVWSAPEQLLAMAQKGRHAYYVLPLTLAARLYAKGIPLRLVNVSAWGGITLVSSDDAVGGWSDLPGRDVHVPRRSSPPDALFRYFLHHERIDETDIRLVYSSLPEIAQLVRTGRIDTAVMMEPQTTRALAGGARIVLDFEKEWQRIHGADAALPSLGFGGTPRFLEDNPELARRFEHAYAEACGWIAAHPAEAGALAEKYLSLPAPLIVEALPRLGLRYVAAADAKQSVETFFSVLHDDSPEMIGGRIPDAGFYQE
jgi:ABC-type nitrate/sulfonate/bicarbonate transport systems, periplasmic components